MLVYLTSFTVCSGDIKERKKKKALKMKKKSLKMINQLVIFRAFFLFFCPLTLNLKKNPVNQLIKRIWPYNKISQSALQTRLYLHKSKHHEL